MHSQAHRVYEFGDYCLDPVRRVLSRLDGTPVPLTAKVFDTLRHLVEHPGELLEKQALLAAVWPNVVVEESNLNKAISLLRRTLGDEPGAHEYIATIPGRGYQFVRSVAIRDVEDGAAVAPAASAGSKWRSWPYVAAIAVVALLATIVAPYLPIGDAPDIEPAPAPRGSIAVLPFDNLSPDPENAYFAAGIHTAILDELSSIESLTVKSRTSVLRYDDSPLSVPEIGMALNAAAVMEGSVRFDGNRIRVSVQLVDTATDRRLWGEVYEHELERIFAMETDIAANVVAALQSEFSPAERARIETPATQSVEAYALYLKSTEARLPEAMALLQRAIEIDPQFALAHAALARRYAFELTNTDGVDSVSPDQAAAREQTAIEHARRAIAIDPDVPYAHSALAIPAVTGWRWSEAEELLAQAVEVGPSELIANNTYGYLLSALERHEEAVALGRRAVELNPGNPNAGWYGYWLAAAGEHAEAATVLEAAIAGDPTMLLNRDWLAFVEIARGNAEAALEQLELSERLAGANRPVALVVEWAYSYGRLERKDDAERLLREIETGAEQGRPPGAGGWAMAYLATGDPERALQWLEIAAQKASRHERDEGFYNLINLKIDPTDDPVLRQPEFAQLLRMIKGD